MSDLLNLIHGDGIDLKRKGADEWAGPCPGCGGTDRFIVHPERGRYWCRQCGKHGDAWQYLKDFHGMSDREAAEWLGVARTPPSSSPALRRAGTGRPNRSGAATLEKVASWNAPKIAPDAAQTKNVVEPDRWHSQADKLIERAHKALLASPKALAWLKNTRGLTEETARRFRLGLITENHYPAREAWGLPRIDKDDDTPKKLFIPAGLLIPAPRRLRIRRSEPGEHGRYYIVPGSDVRPFIIGGEHPPEATPAVIVESELDAILPAQELPQPITIVALGTTSAKPAKHPDLVENLRRRPAVFLIQDSDKAGHESAREWKRYVPTATAAIIPQRYGKDLTEAFLAGLDLRRVWFPAAMQMALDQRRGTAHTPAAAPSAEPWRTIALDYSDLLPEDMVFLYENVERQRIEEWQQFCEIVDRMFCDFADRDADNRTEQTALSFLARWTNGDTCRMCRILTACEKAQTAEWRQEEHAKRAIMQALRGLDNDNAEHDHRQTSSLPCEIASNRAAVATA